MKKENRQSKRLMHVCNRLLLLLFVMLSPTIMHAQGENGAILKVCEGMTTTKETAQFPLSKVVRLSFTADGTLVMKTGDGTGAAVAELPMKNDAVMRVTMGNYEESQSKNTVAVSAAGYSTLYSAFQVVVPEDAEVHTPKYGNNRIKINDKTKQAAGTILPPRTGILLKNQGSYDFKYTDETPASATTCLTGSSVAAPVSDYKGQIYSLAAVGGETGFYKYISPKTVGGKAFLVVENAQELKMIQFDLDNQATAIEDETAEQPECNTPAYNIAGQLVDKSFRGIIIKDGRKILRK